MWNDNNPVAYSDPSGYESGGCSINVNNCGVNINSDHIFVQVSGSIGPASGTITASNHGVTRSVSPALNLDKDSASHLGRAAAGFATRSGRAFRSAAGSVLKDQMKPGVMGVIGIANPAHGKTTNDAVDQPDGGASFSVCLEYVCASVGTSKTDGSFAAVGVGTPGVSLPLPVPSAPKKKEH